MDFTKMQATGNDFVLVDGRAMTRDWSGLAKTVCDRHLGIGADSLIILLASDRADFGMRTFDADGSEAETCGNGIRCVARYLLDKSLIAPDRDDVTVATAAAINHVTFLREHGRVARFRVNMSRPRFGGHEIPFEYRQDGSRVMRIDEMLTYQADVNGTGLRLNLVSMGNPHAVHFTEQSLTEFPMSVLGPAVERLPVFPNRTNFEVARVLDDNHIEARVWERGVGETMACGSGACAIAVASRILGYTGPGVEIQLRGGTLQAEWNGTGEAVLSGPAETVFEGRWPDEVP